MSVEKYIKSIQDKASGNKKSESIGNKEVKMQIMNAVKNKISDSRDIDIFNIESAKEKIENSAIKWIEEEINNEFRNEILSIHDKYEIYDLLINSIFGFGIIEPLLKDKEVTEIMINGPKSIYIEKNRKIQRAKDKRGKELQFSSGEELRNVIDKIVSPINRKVDESNPIVDARLPDGSRVNVVLDTISLDGTAVTIRKFPEKPYTMEELQNFGTISERAAELLKIMVKSRYNIIVSGGTGSGKTTFLNALSMYIPKDERIITIEDSAELKFTQVENMVRLETRPANLESKGQIDIRDLVKTSLRMRPNRIIVGEIRGGEALDMLQAMNTGHDGSLSTGHANSSEDMLLRLETMALMAGMELPLESIKRQIASSIDIIIHLNKLRDGTRKVVQITEVLGMENKEIKTKDLYVFKETGYDEEKDEIIGELTRTENEINNNKKFITAGIKNYSDYL
ncbi:CpaF family protein [Oceanirhabdus sp. W0125-5]|uniref:CpaF family protein n=1 Tax=Oceanirhabdus sp. W0125-5 TaxID=2999116 RepID=UPI0022F324B2|nr:CpaF family protein [Oceanirhabdus sp. W0125-5]WBW95956.1 CpaF family protein [Oceanirhabdus sp. W0125-5]